MSVRKKTYHVGIQLTTSIELDDFVFSVENFEYQVSFCNNIDAHTNLDLIIADIEVNKLETLPAEFKKSTGEVIILNSISSPVIEINYENAFPDAEVRYKSLKKIDKQIIKEFIETIILKSLLKQKNIQFKRLFGIKYSRLDLWLHFQKTLALLLPILLIVFYIIYKLIKGTSSSGFSLVCYFGQSYNPDCKTDWNDELKLIALLYSLLNLAVYYDFILDIFGNINSDMFQFNTLNKIFHKGFKIIAPMLLFVSALLILKELFVFRYASKIASDHNVAISQIFDTYFPYLNDKYIIRIFLFLDLCLWCMILHFFNIKRKLSLSFSSSRQTIILKEARTNFARSVFFDLLAIFFVGFLMQGQDPTTTLLVQLGLLQLIYLYINVRSVYDNYKFS